MTPVEILRTAKKELAERGLNKGHYFKDHSFNPFNYLISAVPEWKGIRSMPSGPCCVIGACIATGAYAAEGEEGKNWFRSLYFLAKASYITHKRAPQEFNDLPSTTIDDVQLLLDHAIALAE